MIKSGSSAMRFTVGRAFLAGIPAYDRTQACIPT